MLADPKPGNSYRQEFLEDVAEDMGKVQRLNANVSVPYGEFEDCLKTKEWTPLERGSIEHKYYASDIVPDIGGLVITKEHKGKTVRSELVDVLQNVTDTGDCPQNLQDALDALCNEESPPPNNCE